MWLLTTALASPPPCATPDALSALQGLGPASHPAMVTAPANLDGRGRPTAMGKSVYGGHYEFYLDTPNFTINWWDADIDPDVAEAAAEALEDAWEALVEEQGWTPPVSSDQYLIWVLLDPELGSTGWTTEYYTDEYPNGYPVVYLDPYWAKQPAFFGALAAHEFMHTLQYALREWGTDSASEPWYWEASANWASELSEPDRDGYQYASAWYAEQADLAYDSMDGSHQYGMFVFNAWLEEQLTGPDGMRQVWELSATNDASWDVLLAESTGEDTAALWGGFTGAYANGTLSEASQYTPVTLEGALVDGAAGRLPELGTHYYRVTEDVRVTATGDVVLADADGHGAAITAAADTIVGVTAITAGSYTLSVEADADTDADADADTDTDTDADTDADADTDEDEAAVACGCDAGGIGGVWAIVLAGALARRRSTKR